MQTGDDVEMNPSPGKGITGEDLIICMPCCAVVESPMSPFSVADDNTAVYEVFRVHFDQLVTAMGTSLTALIPVLYSKGLISGTDRTNLTTLTGVGNINKATRLLTAVETTMKAEPRAARVVRELCEAVNDQPALRHVADRITAALGE